MPHLASLTIDRSVRQVEAHDVLAGAPLLLSLFSSLPRLTLGRESAAVPLLLPHPTRLGHLALHLLDERLWTDLVLFGRRRGAGDARPALAACGRALSTADVSITDWAGAAVPSRAARALTVAPLQPRSAGPAALTTICCRCTHRRLHDALLAQFLGTMGGPAARVGAVAEGCLPDGSGRCTGLAPAVRGLRGWSLRGATSCGSRVRRATSACFRACLSCG
jgi:hypothetical protein